jgi:hypothetical protein
MACRAMARRDLDARVRRHDEPSEWRQRVGLRRHGGQRGQRLKGFSDPLGGLARPLRKSPYKVPIGDIYKLCVNSPPSRSTPADPRQRVPPKREGDKLLCVGRMPGGLQGSTDRGGGGEGQLTPL